MSKEAEIRFTVRLDESNIPDSIHWEATEADFEGKKPCGSIMISIWDREEKNALSIDLWTKKMEVGEMNAHFYLTIMKMAETYLKATNNKEIADMIKRFGNDFADKVDEIFNT
jgi:gliding motility-associated protein GldC